MQLNRGVELFEMDGDRAFGQSVRQRANAGEGLGRKNDAFAFAIGVAETAMEATGEDRAQDGILAAVAGADGGVAFVEEEGGALLGVMDAAAQSTGGEVGGERGIGTKQTQELQTESFAGLLHDRLDGEIGSDLGGRKAMSMENPKGDQGSLVLGAVEVGTEKAHEGVGKIQHLGIGASGYRVIGGATIQTSFFLSVGVFFDARRHISIIVFRHSNFSPFVLLKLRSLLL